MPGVEHRSVMRQKSARHFPFVLVGIVLIVAAVLPTVIGMVRGFYQAQRGENATAVDRGVAMAFHPALIAFGVVGLLLIVIGFIRGFRRGGGGVA